MPHVVTQACQGCKTSTCVDVCPADCFYEGEQQLFIHPDECIDCEACVGECPNGAIYLDERLPHNMRVFLQLNEEHTMSGELPNIVQSKKQEVK